MIKMISSIIHAVASVERLCRVSRKMLQIFLCETCKFQVEVGGCAYHYQHSGYKGVSLFACRACGTAHTLRTAASSREPEFFYLQEVTVESVPVRGRARFVLWLSRHRRISLIDALALSRRVPLVVSTPSWQRSDHQILSDLKTIGAVLSFRAIDKVRNRNYGPVLVDDELSFYERQNQGQLTRRTVPSTPHTPQKFLQCQHCSLVGGLVMGFESHSPCPSCKHVPMQLVSTSST